MGLWHEPVVFLSHSTPNPGPFPQGGKGVIVVNQSFYFFGPKLYALSPMLFKTTEDTEFHRVAKTLSRHCLIVSQSLSLSLAPSPPRTVASSLLLTP